MNEITHIVIAYGGPLLFVAGFAEQSGLPFPGALFLLAAGALAANGIFDLIAGIGWAAAGCVTADAIWFSLGHRGKSRVFQIFPHLQAVRVKLRRATLARAVLHGMRMLTVAKFLPFGTIIPMHAGALEVHRLRFLLVDAFSSIVYAAVFAALGFAFHDQLEQLVALLSGFGALTLPLVAVLAGSYVLRWFLKRNAKWRARPDSRKRHDRGKTYGIRT